MVPARLRRGNHDHEAEWLASGRFTVELLRELARPRDLADVVLLDVGCGTKLTKVLLDDEVAIGGYVGVDVSADIVEWLRANVDDPRFEHHHLPVHNALYQPDGVPLGELDALPVGGRRFELISLFSVFTHLDPDDYVAMLRLLRTHVTDDGRLVYTAHLDPDSRATAIGRALQAGLASDDPEVARRAREAVDRALIGGVDPRYTDAYPDRPLLEARYTVDLALELVAGTGWEVAAVHDPVPPHVQHCIVCEPR